MRLINCTNTLNLGGRQLRTRSFFVLRKGRVMDRLHYSSKKQGLHLDENKEIWLTLQTNSK